MEICVKHNVEDCQVCPDSATAREAKIDVQPVAGDDKNPKTNVKNGKENGQGSAPKKPEIKPEPKLEEQESQIVKEYDISHDKVMDFISARGETIKNILDFNNNQLRDNFSFQGSKNEVYIGVDKPSESEELQQTVSLFEDSEEIPDTNFDDLDINLDKQIEDIKRKRVLLLGDSEDNYGYRISCHIAHSLGIANQPENIRMLHLSRYASMPLTIDFISIERKSVNNQKIPDALIIINTKREGETNFSDSLLSPENSQIDHFPSKLKINNLYVICLMKPDTIYQWKKTTSRIFPDFIIPPIGNENPISEDELVIQNNFEKLLDSGNEAEKSIVRIILFITSFFPNLTTDDFNTLVSSWLRIEPKIIFNKAIVKDSEQIVPNELSLLEVWKSKSHSLTEDCFLTQTKDEQGRRIINFKKKFYAETIKQKLEKDYWAFLDEKVSQILDLRLVFNSSDNIARQSGEILAEYLPGKEEKFIDWVLWVIDKLDDAEIQDENLKRILRIPDSENPDDTEKTSKKYFYYGRLKKLFRTILGKPSLKQVIPSIIEKSIQNRFFQPALTIVKNLKVAPNFDESYWLEQLIIRGENKTREDIRKYLFNSLKKIDIDVIYKKLKNWLPKENVDNYSQLNKLALILLVDCYSNLSYKFNEKLYDNSPTDFPLFQFEDRKTAHKKLGFLAKYLLYSMNLNSDTEDKPYIFYVAVLIEKWSNILCKNSLSINYSIDNENLGNREILDILFEKIISFSQEKDQENIIAVWKEILALYAYISKHSNDWKIREEHTQKYEFVANLIEIFMNKQWSAN